MNDLYENVYQSRPPVIDGLLYTGAYLFVGAPKVGKSFLMAQLAYHVNTGLPLCGYPVRQGTVLYLALEDDHRRLQERLLKAAKKTIADLKAKLAEVMRERDELRSVRGYLSMGTLEKENRDLRQRVKQYQSVMEQHGLSHLFGKRKDQRQSKEVR